MCECPAPPLAPGMPAAQGFAKLLLTSTKENSLQPGRLCAGKGLEGTTALCPKAPRHRSVGSATNKLLFELRLAPEGWKSPAVLSRGASATWGALPWKA